MSRNQQRLLRLAISILATLTLTSSLLGQASTDSKASAPVIDDWSHHRLIFSKPADAEQALRVERDPRYRQQLALQSPARLQEPEVSGSLGSDLRIGSDASLHRKNKNRGLNRDWSQDMGSGASVGAGNYPMKYQLGITGASCASDFVVYGTGLSGSSGQASIVAYNNLYSGCNGIALGTAANFAILGASTVTNAGNSVVTGANIGISPGTSLTGFPPGILTAPAVEQLGNPVAAQAQADATTAFNYYQGLTGAAVIAPVMDGLTFTPGLYKAGASLALSAGATVTLNGSGTYIFQIGSTLNIAGTVVLSGGATAGNVIWLVGSSATLEGTAIAAGDIVAYASISLDGGASVAGRTIALTGAITMIDNAVTAVDTVPSAYWAYNTAGTVLTSPVPSLDGTQIAYVQRDGTLTLLKWAASGGTFSSPMTLAPVTHTSYPGCTAPCMTQWNLRNSGGAGDNDTGSSVFYDYGSDTAYVGDDAGFLHKFTPVFNGVLAEVGGSWPVQLNATAPTALSSPVYDSVSGNVLVGDAGGYLYWVGPTAAVTQSARLDYGTGIVDSPMVDSTFGSVYVFSSSDGSGGCPVGTGGANCSVVFVVNTSFSAGDVGPRAIVGTSTVTGTMPSPMHDGDFDSTYKNSGDATGNLYVCGNTGGDPILYQVHVVAGSFGAISVGPILSSSTMPCSPVTDVVNPNAPGGPTEWIFASAEAEGVSTPCGSSGCIFNFQVTPWQPSTAYTVGQEVLDSNFQIQVVSVAGTSGATAPGWSTTAGGSTHDHTGSTLIWVDQGVQSAFTPAPWAPSFAYSAGNLILDSNGNVEDCIFAFGASGGSAPNWNTTPGGGTGDLFVDWENLGAIATAALASTGGTSGIIIDNTVGSGTEAGASQVYFSTLGNQACTGGTGGCAVQASQPALQ